MGKRTYSKKGRQLLVSPEIAMDVVADATQIPISIILSSSMEISVRRARRILYYTIYRYCGLKYKEVGAIVNRETSGVAARVRRVNIELKESRPSFDREVADIIEDVRFKIRLKMPRKTSSRTENARKREEWLNTHGLTTTDWFAMSRSEQIAFKRKHGAPGDESGKKFLP